MATLSNNPANLSSPLLVKYEMHSPPSSSSSPISSMGSANTPSNKENPFGPNSVSSPNNSPNNKCKRKINFSHLGIPKGHHQPATVARRNARERNRVKQVNNGFAALKQHIPMNHRSKKMSKVETLRCAVDYIKNLKTMLDLNLLGVGASSSPSSSSSEGSSQNNHQDGGNNDGSAYMDTSYANNHSHSCVFISSVSPTTSSGGSGDDMPPSPSQGGGYYTAQQTSTTDNNNQNIPALSSSHPQTNNANSSSYDYENYEPVSPEDEELLDCISWWQQS